jgi:alkyl sulfatase BDS1-like metallo-beta-lactamase superfamily hydrolase
MRRSPAVCKLRLPHSFRLRIRSRQPEYLLNTHARPIMGKEKVAKALTGYMDLIALTYDQTLRGILKGLGPDDLRYFIYKPAHLKNAYYNAEVYGETTWFPSAVFYYQMGWYDHDATKIFQIPPKEEAERLVMLMGGRDKVVAAAKEALDKREYAWAAELVNYFYKIDPNDAEARQVKADALRKLGELAIGSIGRSFLISEARVLEGKGTIPKVVPPNPALIAADPTTYVNYHGPIRSGGGGHDGEPYGAESMGE